MSCTVWSNLSLQKDCNIQDFLEGHHASSCHFATSGRQVPLWFRGLPLNYPEREDDPVTGRTRSLEALRARGEKLASCSVSFSKQYWRFACLALIWFAFFFEVSSWQASEDSEELPSIEYGDLGDGLVGESSDMLHDLIMIDYVYIYICIYIHN